MAHPVAALALEPIGAGPLEPESPVHSPAPTISPEPGSEAARTHTSLGERGVAAVPDDTPGTAALECEASLFAQALTAHEDF